MLFCGASGGYQKFPLLYLTTSTDFVAKVDNIMKDCFGEKSQVYIDWYKTHKEENGKPNEETKRVNFSLENSQKKKRKISKNPTEKPKNNN